MDPTAGIIKKLGGEARVADITGTAFTAPYRSQHDKSRGGTGGLIPQAHHRTFARLRPRAWYSAYGGGIPDPADERTFRGRMMRASSENMQRGAVSQRAGSGFNRGPRADSGNNHSEDCDALGATARRLLLRERGVTQDPVREMKVTEPINIEFLQAERLQNFFAFHRHRPPCPR
jgi:hypothetical protein